MIHLTVTRASQIICTGVTEVCFGCIILGLGYTISFGKHEMTSILGKGCPFWAGIPTVIAGIVGILTGIYKKKILLKLYLGLSTACLFLGIVVTADVALMLKEWRSQGECKFRFCPFDEPSILLIILVICWVLISIMALTGILEASLPLLCPSDHNSTRNTLPYNGYSKRQGSRLRRDDRDDSYNRAMALQTAV